MAEKRNITKEDILLRTRLGAEGARLEVKGPLLWEPTAQITAPHIVLDGCDTTCSVRPYERSRLGIVIEGNDVTISDMGEVVGTGTLQTRSPWRDKLMRDGITRINDILVYDTTLVNSIMISYGCFAAKLGKGCKFCNIGPWLEQASPMSFNETLEAAKPSIEATVIAIENGYRGVIVLVGGAAPPARRGQFTTDMFEAVMTQFNASIDDDTLSQLQIASDVYPPDDLGELHKWKALGLNSTQFDCQVMDPAYFRAICPGRGDQKHWHEAQEAAAEVFGRGRGSSSLVVSGIEPMGGLLEGIEERVSKGVYVMPMPFGPGPLSPMEGMRPPSAEWYVEANEKIVDIYLKYADTFDVDLTEDDRWGYTRRGHSYTECFDELSRRLQEMGKLPPGLPKQDGIELA